MGAGAVMNREQLIAAATKAINSVRWNHALPHASRGGANWTDADLARAAFAVFEQAYAPACTCRMALGSHAINCPAFEQTHTPTDDELVQRALRTADSLDKTLPGDSDIEAWSDGERFTTDDLRALAAGFRRTVQDEPAGDEREAIIDALLEELGWEWDEVPEEHIPSSKAILGDMADRVLAVSAGFRRTAQGEPTDDEQFAKSFGGWTPDEVARNPRAAAEVIERLRSRVIDGFRRTVQGEPTDAAPPPLAPGGIGGAFEPWDGAFDLLKSEPIQRDEPSGQAVNAAGELLYGISWGTEIADPDLVRAALRAAAATQTGESR